MLIVGLVLLWLICVIPNYRLWYIVGYEHHNAYWNYRENEYNRHYHRNNEGVTYGSLLSLFGPVSLFVGLVWKHATPIPPSRAKELETLNGIRIDELERQLKLGDYKEENV